MNSFKKWFEFCIFVAFSTLARSNKFGTCIGKWEQFQLQRQCKLGLWPTTSLELSTLSCSCYCSNKCFMLVAPPSFASTMLPKTLWEITKWIQIPQLYQCTKGANKLKVAKMKLGMGAHELCDCVHVPTIQPSKIIYQHLPSLQDGGTLHIHENFEELP